MILPFFIFIKIISQSSSDADDRSNDHTEQAIATEQTPATEQTTATDKAPATEQTIVKYFYQ